MRPPGAVAAALAAAALLAGCGEELTGGEWVNAADDICTDATNRAAALVPPYTVGEIVDDADERISIFTDVRDRILALAAPSNVDDAALDSYIAELNDDIAVLEAYKRTVRANAPSTFLDVTAGQAATQLGLAGCVTFSDTIVQMQPAEKPEGAGS